MVDGGANEDTCPALSRFCLYDRIIEKDVPGVNQADVHRLSEDYEMSNEAERGRGRVPVRYHQFDISDEDGPTGPDLESGHNGLVRVADGVTIVMTGVHTGDVEVTVALHATEPAPEIGDWQEIVEVSAHSASGDLTVRGVMDDLDEELPALSFRGPGNYRLRIHARGRDTAVDLAPDEITEWYVIQAWPAPAGEARVLRQTDDYGASVRAR